MLKVLRQAKIPLRVAVVIALAYLLYVFLARHSAGKRFSEQPQASDAATSAFDSACGGTAVKILQFYARDGVLYEGKSTVICYGVVNAKSVTIDPPISGVGVSLNRCVESPPSGSPSTWWKRAATYTRWRLYSRTGKTSASIRRCFHQLRVRLHSASFSWRRT